jgi:hypothetical protein
MDRDTIRGDKVSDLIDSYVAEGKVIESPVKTLERIRDHVASMEEEAQQMFRKQVDMVKEAVKERALNSEDVGRFAGGHMLAVWKGLTDFPEHTFAMQMTVAVFATAFSEHYGVEVKAP